MLLVWALVLAQWGLTLLPLRLQSTRTATSFPLWPAVLALHLQLNNPQPWRDADWLAALIPVLISAVAEVLFRKAYADRLAALQAAPAPPREAPSVSYRYKMSPIECDQQGRVYGGELLKLVDVSAGLVAAKHARGPCLTISVDRVIFLQEIRVGDVISISSAVNRAWGSSMEIGVRVMRQSRDDPLGPATYCCHAYLTFVAKPTPPPSPKFFLLGWTDQLGLTSPPTPRKAQLPEVRPRAKEHDALNASFREALFRLEKDRQDAADFAAKANEADQARLLHSLQLEILTEAYLRQSSDVRVEGDEVVGEIEGFVEPVRVKKSDIEAEIQRKEHGGWHQVALSDRDRSGPSSSKDLAGASNARKIDGGETAAVAPVDFADTLSLCLWIVRPQHCNSKSVLFGGTLMRWVEEVSTIAARRVSPNVSWASAGIDSLTFKVSALPGWVVYVRAAVLKVYDSSVEIAAVVTCEDRNSHTPGTKHVSESFFTMVAVDPDTGRPLKGALQQVRLPPGPITEMAESAERRREDRLLEKRVLQRVYA
ncbi:Thioesterase/thiol ester dehydrase-isomerase [Rhodotorula sp. JG-1b]|nr:Thioesterase/thiol ester dehydrase-isomerase [Rhodotorula sp. JG-1b]